jgi:leucyl aminopeptidase
VKAEDLLWTVPQQEINKETLNSQLADLLYVTNRLGMKKARLFLKKHIVIKVPKLKPKKASRRA